MTQLAVEFSGNNAWIGFQTCEGIERMFNIPISSPKQYLLTKEVIERFNLFSELIGALREVEVEYTLHGKISDSLQAVERALDAAMDPSGKGFSNFHVKQGEK